MTSADLPGHSADHVEVTSKPIEPGATLDLAYAPAAGADDERDGPGGSHCGRGIGGGAGVVDHHEARATRPGAADVPERREREEAQR